MLPPDFFELQWLTFLDPIVNGLPADPIATINGKDVVEYLEDFATLLNSQDADAR